MKWRMQLLKNSGNHQMKLRISITTFGKGNTVKYPENPLCKCGSKSMADVQKNLLKYVCMRCDEYNSVCNLDFLLIYA